MSIGTATVWLEIVDGVTLCALWRMRRTHRRPPCSPAFANERQGLTVLQPARRARRASTDRVRVAGLGITAELRGARQAQQRCETSTAPAPTYRRIITCTCMVPVPVQL